MRGWSVCCSGSTRDFSAIYKSSRGGSHDAVADTWLTIKELVVDQLLQLSTGASQPVAIHEAIKAEIAILWPMCQAILAPTATAEEAVHVAHALYVRLEELLAPKGAIIQADQADDVSEELVWAHLSERTGEDYRPVTNWVYRGAMNPEFIRQQDQDERESDDQNSQRTSNVWRARRRGTGVVSAGPRNRKGTCTATESDRLGGGRQLPSHVEELLALKVEQPAPLDHAGSGDREVRYPEWDQEINDYRLNWCRVVERAAEEGSGDIVGAMLSAHGLRSQPFGDSSKFWRPPGATRAGPSRWRRARCGCGAPYVRGANGGGRPVGPDLR